MTRKSAGDELQKAVVEELENGPRSINAITKVIRTTYNHNDHVTRAETTTKINTDDVRTMIKTLIQKGVVIETPTQDEWYQLADWNERPVRVLSASQHVINLAGVTKTDAEWVTESIAAAREQHDITSDKLTSLHPEENQGAYTICTGHYGVLEKYRKTLLTLSEEVINQNTEKAMLYQRLAEATDLNSHTDTHNREIGLRE
jgi:hypothetical protein